MKVFKRSDTPDMLPGIKTDLKLSEIFELATAVTVLTAFASSGTMAGPPQFFSICSSVGVFLPS